MQAGYFSAAVLGAVSYTHLDVYKRQDLEAHFTEKVIGNMAVDVLDIGTVHFPTGQIFACDPLVELEDTLPFLQKMCIRDRMLSNCFIDGIERPEEIA